MWKCIALSREESAQQADGVSCGVFTCANATLRLCGIPTKTFNMEMVPRMRVHIANTILTFQCHFPYITQETYDTATTTGRLAANAGFTDAVGRRVEEDMQLDTYKRRKANTHHVQTADGEDRNQIETEPIHSRATGRPCTGDSLGTAGRHNSNQDIEQRMRVTATKRTRTWITETDEASKRHKAENQGTEQGQREEVRHTYTQGTIESPARHQRSRRRAKPNNKNKRKMAKTTPAPEMTDEDLDMPAIQRPTLPRYRAGMDPTAHRRQILTSVKNVQQSKTNTNTRDNSTNMSCTEALDSTELELSLVIPCKKITLDINTRDMREAMQHIRRRSDLLRYNERSSQLLEGDV